MKLSKDGRYLLARSNDVITLYNATNFNDLATLNPVSDGTNYTIRAMEFDPLNNHVYVTSDTPEDDADAPFIERFDVGSVTVNDAGGDGEDTNPPTDHDNTQATEETLGDPETDNIDDEASEDGIDTSEEGLFGDGTIQALANSLGTNQTGARTFGAGLFISGLALAAALFARSEGLGNGGMAAGAGAFGGALISLGLGLLEVWLFVFFALLTIAYILIKVRS